MPENHSGFPEVNRMIHEPARLAILTVLSACESADFIFLQTATGLSRGALSVQLTRLDEADLIYVDKALDGKKTQTTAGLTSIGKQRLNEYWQTMKTIQRQGSVKAI